MADDTTTKAPPTLAELEGKVQRLTNQVETDGKAAAQSEALFASAVKKGDVDKALELADERTTAKSVATKSASQLETAKRAVASAKHAANADKVAAIHDQMRDDAQVQGYFAALQAFGVTRITVERSEETGKLLINSVGPSAPKRTRSGGGGGSNGRGQSVTVDGTEYASASAALHAFFPEAGPLNRDSILSKLAGAGHTVA